MTGECVGVLRQPFRQHIDRNLTAEPCVFRAIDLAHSPRADRRQDFVRPKLCAGGQRHRFVCVLRARVTSGSGCALERTARSTRNRTPAILLASCGRHYNHAEALADGGPIQSADRIVCASDVPGMRQPARPNSSGPRPEPADVASGLDGVDYEQTVVVNDEQAMMSIEFDIRMLSNIIGMAARVTFRMPNLLFSTNRPEEEFISQDAGSAMLRVIPQRRLAAMRPHVSEGTRVVLVCASEGPAVDCLSGTVCPTCRWLRRAGRASVCGRTYTPVQPRPGPEVDAR